MKRKRQPVASPAPSSQSALATPQSVVHPVLQRLYPQLHTLRQYLLSWLPASSKKRRRRIEQLGLSPDATASPGEDAALGLLLDTTLIGLPKADQSEADKDALARDMESFSQQLPESTLFLSSNPGHFLQPETVDFVIWLLFKRHPSSHRPPHLLCYAFQRASVQGQNGLALGAAPGIPGILSHAPNTYVDTVKGPLWCKLHSHLGQGGDRIMIDLLLDCGIFRPLQGQNGNYVQISGFPVSELKPNRASKTGPHTIAAKDPKLLPIRGPLPKLEARTPASIKFVRSRMLYARAALNAKGGVRFGMRHIHVLNRFSDRNDPQQTIQIMRYIFPRQFGLHNVFTSTVDYRDTALPFKDYTLREKEIQQQFYRESLKHKSADASIEGFKSHVPKRLRGEATTLVNKLRKLNQKCSYSELLRHYCPVEVNIPDSQLRLNLTGIGSRFIPEAGMEKQPTSAWFEQGLG
ncbi:uncharacterized protein BDZ99DRAFT_304375 [Mytilinidion resinicola]|uniref:Telomerase reverse transcriptase n=1 Tax=Mytilinidion resinicola TaxID=574789 RepID=A0A6A6YQ07_9PEZI|nr:uncharacterized protein BDZ99DRAFT_304375 [Mytilinidion resinicola]KAF2810104.1 hypothetical protein BDZ99DRAFT_304375 [Mytilinidion resinicola]